jgi:hypothetical protein
MIPLLAVYDTFVSLHHGMVILREIREIREI